MRPLLLALALMPLVSAHAHDEHQHGSLGKHEHGVAQLNAALDGNTLELELESPAMNLVGFEHAASSAADKARVVQVQAQLGKPLELIALPAAAGCGVSEVELHSPLFGDAPDADEHDEHEHEHSDIHAHYRLTCSNPGAVTQVDLAPLFKSFPGMHKIQSQVIGPQGQKGGDLSAASSILEF
ncbi:DUF2796 domain-containing protein [Pseudomonas schmalbachii]|uniref:DUF2796 domain-containing protein n=1 Tax=Pseudomonas schmalbachii TaxID=2816993 RepID=A0ABS3TNN7_9PSED|nr:DUF2796 domain-containing protein [Pseudomonas schmalbachii]MBO3275266.1 DUF2796 domain-containing protein [Pseudomonas schmalbachii]